MAIDAVVASRTGERGWTGSELENDPSRWIRSLTSMQIEEAIAAARRAAADAREPGTLAASEFEVPSWEPLVSDVRTELSDGLGFCLLRGLPIETLNDAERLHLIAGLGAQVGFLEPQDGQGSLVHHVRDTGKQLLADGAARGYETNIRLDFHTDGADVAALLCLATAKEGGESRLVSAETLYELMAARQPDLAEALEQPFVFDTRGQTDDPTQIAPIFARYRGYLNVLYKRGYIELAQRFEGVPSLRDEQVQALDLLDALCEEPGVSLDMWLEPGDLQLVNNLAILHSRTEYTDHDEPERRRHLLRLWLTMPVGRPLPPLFRATREYRCIWDRSHSGERRDFDPATANNTPAGHREDA